MNRPKRRMEGEEERSVNGKIKHEKLPNLNNRKKNILGVRQILGDFGDDSNNLTFNSWEAWKDIRKKAGLKKCSE